MLLYDNHERIRILLQIQGSVLYSTIPWGCCVAAVALVLALHAQWADEDLSRWRPLIIHPWAANSVTFAISFAIVFRTNIAWNRYWEAARETQFMFSKWADSYTQLVSFINSSELKYTAEAEAAENPDPLIKKLEAMASVRLSLAHYFSLLSALAAHRLTHGDIARMSRRSEKFGTAGSGWATSICFCGRLRRNWHKLIVSREDLRFDDATGALDLPTLRVYELEDLASQIQSRVRKQKRGSVMDFDNLTGAVPALKLSPVQHLTRRFSQFPEPSDPPDELAEQAAAELASMRASSAGGFRSARDSTGSVTSNVTWNADLGILAPLLEEEATALQCKDQAVPDRVIMVSEWISEDINTLTTLVITPPPIVSRCYQELSNGMLGFNQSLKMADIPFPFPFSQLLEYLLVILTLIIPVYTARFTGGSVTTPVLAFVVTVSFWSLSEISRALENPFADGPNQLPIIDAHERFVELVRSVYHTRRPVPKKPQVQGSDRPFSSTDNELIKSAELDAEKDASLGAAADTWSPGNMKCKL